MGRAKVNTEDTFDSMDVNTPGVHDDITDSGMIAGDTSLDDWPIPEAVAITPVIEPTIAPVAVEPVAVKLTTPRPAQVVSPKPVVKAPRPTRTSGDSGGDGGRTGNTGNAGDAIVKTAIPLDPAVAEQLRLVAFARSGNYEISSVIRPAIDEVLAKLTSGPAGDRDALAERIRLAPKHSRNSLFSVRITAVQAHDLRLAAIHGRTSVSAIIRAAINRVIEADGEG
jgi:hypothetical protein